MPVREDVYGRVQSSVQRLIEILHQEQRNFFVGHVLDKKSFQGVGKWCMPQVVQQDGAQGPQAIIRAQTVALVLKNVQGVLHQVHSSKRMGQSGMRGSGIHQIGHPQLSDIP